MRNINKLLLKFVLFFINNFLSGTHFFKLKCNILNLLKNVHIDKGVCIVGPLYFGSCVNLTVGSDTFINTGFTIHGNGSVEISENCDIAPDVSFLTGSHKLGTNDRRAGEGLNFSIKIKSGCWIGARATIMGDITIESGGVVGAAALVNKNIPANCVVGGTPAKIIKYLN